MAAPTRQSRPPLDEAARALVIARRPVVRALAACIALLALGSVAMAVLRIGFHHDRVFGLADFFDLNREQNLPTWFESALFAVAALVAVAIGQLERAARRPGVAAWHVFAGALFVMSLDEVARIHEQFAVPERTFGLHEAIHPFTWVLVGVPIMGVVAALFLRFVLALPAATRNGILLAGALFMSGAVVFEVLGGIWAIDHGQQGAVFAAMVTIEECLEIGGALVLLNALLGHLATDGAWRTEVT